MRTRDADVTTVDPEDVAAAAAWAARRAAAQRQVDAARAELAQLTRLLGQEPAPTVLRELTDAQSSTATAQSNATDASGRATTAATAAAQYEATVVTGGQVAVDDATKALSDTLAALLRAASTTSALTATVDGLALRQRYLAGAGTTPPSWDHTTVPFLATAADVPLDPQLVLPAVGEPDYLALGAVLDRLDARVDAVADLVTAESVHQLVQGNLVRSGAALDVAASGAVPDAFDVVRTPQTGDAVTHRVLAVIDAAAGPRWAMPTKPGTLADPLLSIWLTTLLPAPSAVGVTISRRDPSTGELDHPVVLTVEELALDPLGLIRLAADPGELRQRLALVARRRWAADLGEGAAEGDIALTPGAAAYDLDDLVAVADSVRALLGRSRALTDDDLRAPTAGPIERSATEAAAIVTGITDRVTAVEAALDTTVAALQACTGQTDRWAVAEVLLQASDWAVPGSAPQLDQTVPTLPVLQAQAARAAAELGRRLVGVPFEADPGDVESTIRRARTRLSALVGWQLPVLVEVPPPGAAMWKPLTGGTELTGADPASLRSWLDSYALVRPAVGALVDTYDLTEALTTGATLDAAATQLLPGDPDPVWRGPDPAPPAGLTSIVVARSFDGSPTALTGLAVDVWTQRVPGTRQQAAVAFGYDEPDSTPPQVALIAVAPDLTAGRQPGTWDLETLTDTLLATLAMARQRAVAAENTAVRGITVKEAS